MLKSIFLNFILVLGCWIFGIWNGAHASEKTHKSLHSKFQRIELSGNSPPFLKAKQIREDLEATHWLLKQNYARYQLLKDAGTDWDKIFQGPGKKPAFQPESAPDPSFSAEVDGSTGFHGGSDAEIRPLPAKKALSPAGGTQSGFL